MNVFFDSSAWAERYIEESGSGRREEAGLSAVNISLSILSVPEAARTCGLRTQFI